MPTSSFWLDWQHYMKLTTTVSAVVPDSHSIILLYRVLSGAQNDAVPALFWVSVTVDSWGLQELPDTKTCNLSLREAQQ